MVIVVIELFSVALTALVIVSVATLGEHKLM